MSDDVPVIDIESRIEDSNQQTESTEQTDETAQHTSPPSDEPSEGETSQPPANSSSPEDPSTDHSTTNSTTPSDESNSPDTNEDTAPEGETNDGPTAPSKSPSKTTTKESVDSNNTEEQPQDTTDDEGTPSDSYYPFYAEVDPQTLDTLLESVSALVDECVVNITQDQISIQAQDKSNVAMVETTLTEAGFNTFSGSDQTLGVPLDPLKQMTSLASASDTLKLTYQDNTESLRIDLDGLTYQLSLIDPEMIEGLDAVPAPPTEARATLRGEHLKQSVEAAEMLESALSLEATDGDTFLLKANGESDDFSYNVNSGDDVTVSGDAPATDYSEEFLAEMISALDKDMSITLAYQDSYPMELSFSFADSAGTVTYFLAPRIQNE